ncbi:MAG: hypothetical protein P8L85_11000 [Rubripirellula sp.]|nr:hypothetical protein [Rubripirellula sp.]
MRTKSHPSIFPQGAVHSSIVLLQTVLLGTLLLGTLGSTQYATAQQTEEVVLTGQGEELLAKYNAMLESLTTEIADSLPAIDSQRRESFLTSRTALAGIKDPGEATNQAARRIHEIKKAESEADALLAARAILAEVNRFLSSASLDSKLIAAAILRNATPRGLAEFAQQGATEEALLEQLFADEALMKQMLIAGGANGGEYGEAMQVYTTILAKSERARDVGSIFQRLALGTALHMPWLPGHQKGGIHNIVYRTQTTIDQVERYQHYEQAYLDGELDPAFKDMNTWECRFITDDPYSNEDLAWMRQMMRTYRPDHITNPDYKWRFVRIVKSDVPYVSPTSDPSLGTPAQQHIALGGICGRRAFYGRLACRAFGIPSRASTQTGHGAMSHWTPDGWVVCLGAWWSMAWCGPQGGLDFLLDSQAREQTADYMQVLRLQWIGDALAEPDVSIRHGQYGQGGGFWDGLAFYKKRAIVEDAEVEALELAGGMKLGESDELLGDETAEEIEIPEADRTIAVGDNGIITIPAAACDRPTNSTDKVGFMKGWDGGTQIHYGRLGQRPELIRYTVEAPAAGTYELVAKVATVSPKQVAILRLNRRTLLDIPLPYTKGLWQETEPLKVELKEGRNSIMLTTRAPNRGITIKEFRLQPIK